jgi:hypothetical protein
MEIGIKSLMAATCFTSESWWCLKMPLNVAAEISMRSFLRFMALWRDEMHGQLAMFSTHTGDLKQKQQLVSHIFKVIFPIGCMVSLLRPISTTNEPIPTLLSGRYARIF